MAGEKDVDVPPDLVDSFFEQCSQAQVNESKVPLKLLSIKDADHYDVRSFLLRLGSKELISSYQLVGTISYNCLE